MLKAIRIATMLGACLAAPLAPALAQTAAAPAPYKIGFVYVGEIGDFGWTYQHDQARKAVEASLGNRVKTTVIENVATKSAEQEIEKLAKSGHKLIFTASPSFNAATIAVAKKYPDVQFENAGGKGRADNVTTFSNRGYEGRYVAGQVAGLMTKTNTVGYVATHEQPDVIAGLNAFALGVRSVNPTAKVKVVWTRAWVDEAKERKAVQTLVAASADIIGQNTYSPAVVEESEKLGIKSFGQTSDMVRFAPKATLTSIMDDWSTYYVDRAKLSVDGKWTKGYVVGGIDAGMVKLAPFTNVPAEVVEKVKPTINAFQSGMNPFKGPISKRDGALAVKPAEVASENDIATMNWLVQGIEDAAPAPAAKPAPAKPQKKS